MPRRMGRPGLLGTMARTAVVAGTATATVGAVSGHQAKKQEQQELAAQQEQQAQYEQQQQLAQQAAAEQAAQQQAAAPAAPAPGELTEDTINKLKQLGDLKASGVLSDEEFAAAKAKLLGL